MYREFLQALHPTGYRDFRAFGDENAVLSEHANNYQIFRDWVNKQVDAGRDVYVGVATRNKPQGRKLADCAELHALFADFDFKDISEEAILSNLSRFVYPSIIVRSGGGLHVYWLLHQPIDLQKDAGLAKEVLTALARFLGSDPKACVPSFILRVPGTKNFKYDPPRPVVIQDFSITRRYTLSDLVSFLDPASPAPSRQEKMPPIPHGVSLPDRIQMAKTWLEFQDPAIQGQGGDSRTYMICCSVIIGHDIPPEHALPILSDWNSRCSPPWERNDLLTKIKSAVNSGLGARGEKLWLHESSPRPHFIPSIEDFELSAKIEDLVISTRKIRRAK
jgi:hypothetical protein